MTIAPYRQPSSRGRISVPSFPGGGGIRKVRWAVPGKGKRGGARVIYFWEVKPEAFFMLYAFPKSERDDLSPGQLRALRNLVELEFA